jgi:Uri superfamily endonuclease
MFHDRMDNGGVPLLFANEARPGAEIIVESAGNHLSQLEWREPDSQVLSVLAEPGVYQLYLHLPQPLQLPIGRLGTFAFAAGLYVYTGSALGGIGARVARHLRADKRRHWHIDFLLPRARVQAVAVLTTRERLECRLHRLAMERLQGQVIATGFGSSDCRCPAHLGYLGVLEWKEVEERFRRGDNPSV